MLSKQIGLWFPQLLLFTFVLLHALYWHKCLIWPGKPIGKLSSVQISNRFTKIQTLQTPKTGVLFRSLSQFVPQQLVCFSPLWSTKEWVWLLFFFFGSHSFPTLVQVISPSYFSFSPACPQVTNSFLTLAVFSPHMRTLWSNSSFYFPSFIVRAHLFLSSCSSFYPVSPSFAASSIPCPVIPTFSWGPVLI